MPTIDPTATYTTFINAFRCQPAHQDEVVRINVDHHCGRGAFARVRFGDGAPQR